MSRSMPLRVIMFQPRFAALVESGNKTQTVRPPRKNALKAGDALSLRAWTGKPYRSKQRVLRECRVARVENIYICDDGSLFLDFMRLRGSAKESFAKADGFSSADEMVAWFRDTHGLPFQGRVIYWANTNATSQESAP